MGRSLSEEDRQPAELPVDRLGRRHPADQVQDGDLRRLRQALGARRAEGGRPGPVPDDHGRRGPGGERRGHQVGADQARRQDARRHLQGRDHQLERRPDREAEPRRSAARHGDRGRASLRRLRHDLPVHQLPLQGQPGLEAAGRRRRFGPVAGRDRRQGQRGRGQQRPAHRRRDRLRRVRLRAPEQAAVRADGQPGGQGGRADQRSLPGRGGARRLGQGRPLLRHPDRPAGRRQLADHRRQLHPDVRAAGGPAGFARGAQVLRLELRQRRCHGRGPALRADARPGRRAGRADVEEEHQGCRRQGRSGPRPPRSRAQPVNPDWGVARRPPVPPSPVLRFGRHGDCDQDDPAGPDGAARAPPAAARRRLPLSDARLRAGRSAGAGRRDRRPRSGAPGRRSRPSASAS